MDRLTSPTEALPLIAFTRHVLKPSSQPFRAIIRDRFGSVLDVGDEHLQRPSVDRYLDETAPLIERR